MFPQYLDFFFDSGCVFKIVFILDFEGVFCDIRPEWTKMQIQQTRVFSSEPSELAILKE